jgi:hypothetical protein
MRNNYQYIIVTFLLMIISFYGCSKNENKSNKTGRDSTIKINTVSQMSSSDSLFMMHIEVDWSGLLIAWRQYVSNPSGVNADTLYFYLPTNHWFQQDSAYAKTFDIIYDSLFIVEKLMQKQNRIAVKIAFRLLNISDGAFAEDLCSSLGSFIKINPQMFLEELELQWQPNTGLEQLGNNLGEEFLSNEDSSRAEYKRRIDALNSVTIPELKKYRDRCVFELELKLKGL